MKMTCVHCGGEIQGEAGAVIRFCPYCGKTPQDGAQAPDASALSRRLEAEKKPQKRYAIIREALERDPEDFEANQALLFHGRLHEPLARGATLDYSIIKSYLFHVFENPDAYAPEVLDAKYEELLRGPQLQKTMALSENPEEFFALYIRRLARDYVEIFIREDGHNRTLAFGIPRSPRSLAEQCAPQVRRMLLNITASGRLTDAERVLLVSAVRAAYWENFPGFTQYLDQNA